MNAIVLENFGDIDQLILKKVPKPNIQDHEVLIETHAISINPVDAKTRKGKGQAKRMKEESPMILGWDVAGEVVAVGKNVSTFKVGDAVFGMINLPGCGRTYAEYVSAPAEHLALKPDNVSYEEAAAASLAAMTAYQALKNYYNILPESRVLIHAAAGGVGHFAIQIAKTLGAHVIGSASAINKDFVISLGADEVLDYQTHDWTTSIEPVDFILDAIGGSNIDRSLQLLKEKGMIISLPSGLSEDVDKKAAAQNKNGVFFMVQSDAKDINEIASMLKNKTLIPFISTVFSLGDVKKAHEQIETGKTRGKIVLLPYIAA